MSGWPWSINIVQQDNVPLVVSERTVRAALESALMTYTKDDLRIVLTEELRLVPRDELPPQDWSKRDHIRSVTQDWSLAQLIDLAQRVVDRGDVQVGQLPDLIADYRRSSGGVQRAVKNLIFAANGPKPELVLRDAVSNDVEITRNAQFCLNYDRPIGAEGLSFQTLIDWWRDCELIDAAVDDREVGLRLCARLRASLDSQAEDLVFRTYLKRYADGRFDIPALLPQVYLHYDPYTRRARGASGSPLARQRMDFLLLYSDRRRVVIEVDGLQHYADEQTGQANPRMYGQMVAEDRRLRLAGYEVYRFGGHELLAAPDAERTVATFFDELHGRMP